MDVSCVGLPHTMTFPHLSNSHSHLTLPTPTPLLVDPTSLLPTLTPVFLGDEGEDISSVVAEENYDDDFDNDDDDSGEDGGGGGGGDGDGDGDGGGGGDESHR